MFIQNAMAQGAETAQNAAPGGLFALLPYALIFLVFYFLMIRPQKKKLEKEQSFNQSLQKGHEVYLKSGILGTISGMTDKIVTIEIASGVNIKVLRGQIAGATKELLEKKDSKKRPENDRPNKLASAKK